MIDFLTFKSFISIDVLILFYYFGALVLPIGLWMVSMWLIRRYQLFNTFYEQSQTLLWEVLNKKQKIQYAIYAAEQVVDIYENKYPENDQPRKAIEAAKS